MTIDELLKLDGKVSEATQKTIDEAKKESSYGFDLPVMNEILKSSEKSGKLNWTHKQIRSCSYCDKKYDYHTYPRSGRYHRKGDKNHDKPIHYSGIKFNEGFITFAGSGDMCLSCCNEHKVKERLIDYIINNDLNIQIMINDYKPGKYLKDDVRICYSCNKEMYESEMRQEMTLMGGGYYPAVCPYCNAKSSAFGNNHGISNKFGMIHNPLSNVEVQEIKKAVEEFNKEKSKDERVHFWQGKSSISSFGVKEERWMNGNQDVIRFETKTNTYTVGYSYENKRTEFENILNSHGYTKNKRN